MWTIITISEIVFQSLIFYLQSIPHMIHPLPTSSILPQITIHTLQWPIKKKNLTYPSRLISKFSVGNYESTQNWWMISSFRSHWVLSKHCYRECYIVLQWFTLMSVSSTKLEVPGGRYILFGIVSLEHLHLSSANVIKGILIEQMNG